MHLLDKVYFDNPLWAWMVAGGVSPVVFLALLVVRRILVRRLMRRAEKTETEIDDIVAGVLSNTYWFILLLAGVFAGSRFLTLPGTLASFLRVTVIVVLLAQGGLWANALLREWVRAKSKEEEGARSTAFLIINFAGRLVVWSLVLLLSLDNLGVDVTALIAGLGVGGIAVALAVQNILGDLFASVSIAMDQPFEIGDFVIVGTEMGTVEHVGLKTTRVRSMTGEQLVLSNADMLSSRIRNFKRMKERRIVFTIGVTYETPFEKLKTVSSLIREIIEKQADVRFDRTHFSRYGDFALLFEVVYFVTLADYATYMDRQQSINLAIFRRFEEAGIRFAYPTQTVFLRNETGATA